MHGKVDIITLEFVSAEINGTVLLHIKIVIVYISFHVPNETVIQNVNTATPTRQ
jgi:hypothetical protein